MSSTGYGLLHQIASAQVRAAGVCDGCGGRFQPSELHGDHVIPRRDGGPDHVSNEQALCARCHGKKTYLEQQARRSAAMMSAYGASRRPSPVGSALAAQLAARSVAARPQVPASPFAPSLLASMLKAQPAPVPWPSLLADQLRRGQS